MSDKPLTMTQHQILRFIRSFIEENGFSPSMTEIGTAARLSSVSSVSHQLNLLEKAGYITRRPCQPRSVRLAA